MSSIPLRLRLTAGFVVAMLAVVAGTGAFAYLRVRAGLDETIDEALHARAGAVARLVREGQDPLSPARPLRPEIEDEDAAEGLEGEEDEGFTQVLAPDGRLRDATATAPDPVLTAAQLRAATGRAVLLERRVPGIEGQVRVLARPAAARPGSSVVVVGQSIDDRDETLSSLLTAFAVVGPLAVLVAAGLGYVLAAAGLAPIEAMRRRAAEISLEHDGERLPLPAASDEVRRLGETLNGMLDRLRRSFERERRFTADASHELRTPIAVVRTEIEAALATGDYGPQVREALVAARDECDRLSQLADDLLVMARSGDGGLPVRFEGVPVREALEGVARRFERRAHEHGRSLTVDAPSDLRLSADPLRLRQAVGNLVDNALRHGNGEVVLSARAEGDGVEITVRDQGAGFEPGFAGQAFERFSRADAARARGGAGLGLAIVRAIAQAHGGRAELASQGAGVTLWLPAQRVLAASPAQMTA